LFRLFKVKATKKVTLTSVIHQMSFKNI
jgi:hypothetical protein